MNSDPELPEHLRERLQRIMDARPDTSPLCHPHWAKQFLRDELEVLTCACREPAPIILSFPDKPHWLIGGRAPRSMIERRLLYQERRERQRTDPQMELTMEPDVSGTEDATAARMLSNRAVAALRALYHLTE